MTSPAGWGFPFRVDFLIVIGLWGDNFLFKFGLAHISAASPSLYSIFQDTDSVFSTTSRTRGESGSSPELGIGVEVESFDKKSNLPGGADTGRCPYERIKFLEKWQVAVLIRQSNLTWILKKNAGFI